MSVEPSDTQPDATRLLPLESLETYVKSFMDLALWEPFVKDVCTRHGLTAQVVRPGLAGTYPTFIVGDRWVVKFFGRLFDGGAACAAERDASRLLKADPTLPVAALLSEGQLLEGNPVWTWPYLIFSFIPGSSFGQVDRQVSWADKMILAHHLGRMIRQLHSLPLASDGIFKPDWADYTAFIERQHATCSRFHREQGVLPPRLLDQIDAYLPPVEHLLDTSTTPHLIHADLTRDHILGWFEGGHWQMTGLIDFGDAMVGNLAYELVALHLDLFAGDKRLLLAFLAAYGLSQPHMAALTKQAMALTLMHRFPILEFVARSFPWITQAPSLAQMETLLWDLESPGYSA